MQISLISPLSTEECIVRLEKSRKQDEIPFSSEYHPPYGEVNEHTFNLRVNIGKYLPFMYGELVKVNEGTLITCSMKTPKLTQRRNTLWTVIALPFFSFLACFSILNGFEAGFSTTHLLTFLIGIGFFFLHFYVQKITEKQSELDKQELLDFLEKTLDAKIRLP